MSLSDRYYEAVRNWHEAQKQLKTSNEELKQITTKIGQMFSVTRHSKKEYTCCFKANPKEVFEIVKERGRWNCYTDTKELLSCDKSFSEMLVNLYLYLIEED